MPASKSCYASLGKQLRKSYFSIDHFSWKESKKNGSTPKADQERSPEIFDEVNASVTHG